MKKVKIQIDRYDDRSEILKHFALSGRKVWSENNDKTKSLTEDLKSYICIEVYDREISTIE